MLSQWAVGRKSDGHEATRVSGGEGGIRTHGRLRDTRSPGVPDRPLQHLSALMIIYLSLKANSLEVGLNSNTSTPRNKCLLALT